MVRLYMDENVRAQITQGLRNRGVDIVTVQEDGLSGKPDGAILDRSTELGRVLYSEDEDLLAEASSRQSAGLPFAGVVYGHQRVAVGQCIESLEVIAQAGEADDCQDRVVYIPL